ncbi:unnamed protein product [Mytilus edulis]|uniref:Integrase catalytic domain-containing protein n=1 Tax=Mytilus edulis TaxID=6550 RepID=A0A8S3V1R1_MYTED|nr:unnamed protein product [Mytilus edulis]
MFQKEIIETEIQKMLDEDIIQPSNSPWSSPILLVAKKTDPSDPSGKLAWRFCLDYRSINSVTKKDAYPLPRIDTSLDTLGGNNWFTTVDLTSGYWQCEVEPKNKCSHAFEKLKQKLISSPILAYPNMEGKFVLDTDACDNGIGAVLSQIQNGEEKVIAYASKTLNNAQRKYCTTYKELLAIVSFVKHFRHYLWGRPFKVRTDHASLIWLKNFKDPEGILARWITILETFDYALEHRKGSLHSNADGLSRRPHRKCVRTDCPDCTNESLLVSNILREDAKSSFFVTPLMATQENMEDPHASVQDLDISEETENSQNENLFCNWLAFWTHEQIAEMQNRDPNIKKILDLKSLVLWSQWESIEIRNGLLFYQFHSEIGEEKLVLVAPKEMRDKIFSELHEKRTAGHMGRDKTLDSIRRRFYWPGMSSDIACWVKQCNLCARCKRGPGIGKAPLQQSLVGSPFDRIGIDIVGPCPITQDGNEYMIVVQDYFTKWTEVYPVVRHNALTVADKLATQFFCRFGLPSQIHSDQGREFESDLFANLCSLFGIEKTRTCPYRPQSDGLVERMNRTLKQMLSIFANLNRNDWDDHIPYLLMAFRATIQDSIGVSPHKMMFGRDMQCPIDIIAGVPTQNKSETCPVQYIEWLKYTLDLTYSFANENLKKAANRQKKHYDRGVKPRSFSEGEFAWRWYPPRANIKFGLGWIGPYLIKRKITSVTYQIQRDPKSKDIVVHVDHLKPYNGREIPEIWQVQDEQVENEPVYDDTQTLDFLPDDFEDEEINEIGNPILDNSFNEREFTVEPVTPPRRTRCGRTVHKPLKYSPSL